MISLLDATFAFMIAVLLLYWFRVSRRKLLSQNSVLNLHIFFGTQTGTAELYAHRLDALLSQASNVAVSVDNLKHFREESLSRDNSTLSIFIVATYGDGEPPDDATHFYDWLQAHCDPLTGLRYAVFGLGDSGYLEFNQFAKQVDCRLSLLGASRLLPLCLGDASRNIEADFRAWQRSICQLFNMTECNIDAFLKTDVQDLTFVYPSLPEVESLGGAFTGEPERLLSFRHNTPPFSSSNPFLATVTLNQELFRGTDQSCRLLELSLSGSGIKYTAGDHVAVFPQNSKELVERLCDLLQVDPEQHIHIISGLEYLREVDIGDTAQCC
uniref:Flavodoxin-like domain-containing protein n=1 Tax=Mesocestoides corti TaxID=53468 RepID=A0A5K3EX69_MESCO